MKHEDTKHFRTLKVELGAADRIQRAERCALLDQEQELLEGDKKESAAHYKSEIDKRITERRALAQEYRQGFRWADVECVHDKDLRAGKMVTTRLDTGEVVASRDLTNEEKQADLDI